MSRLLGTSILSSQPFPIAPSTRDPIGRAPNVTMVNCLIENCGTGIHTTTRHRAPSLDDVMIRTIESDQPEYVTRHIEKRFLKSARSGYFQFGTLTRYRAEEGAISGRLGDHQESRMQEVFNSRSGFFENAALEGVEIRNTSFIGTNKHIVVETIVNDYCACASVGRFSYERGIRLRNCESDPTKRPEAFITYHLASLRKAISEHLLSQSGFNLPTLLGRNVAYGEKDRHWDVEERFSYQQDRDALAIWLSIAFVKSHAFSHEEEYRLLIVDRSGPGGLTDIAQPYIIPESLKISQAIVDSGTY